MENVRRIDWGRPRCVGRARERRRCETVTRVFAIQFANTWNIYTCEQSDMEASFGSGMTRWEIVQFLRSMHILTIHPSIHDRATTLPTGRYFRQRIRISLTADISSQLTPDSPRLLVIIDEIRFTSFLISPMM